MKTDELVAMLAMQVEPVPAHAARRRMGGALLLGGALAALWMLAGFGLRPDLGAALAGWNFWGKLLLPASLAAAGWVLVERLARPGVATAPLWRLAALPVLAVWLLALWVLWQAPADQRGALLLGATWRVCMANIATHALPVFIAALWALRTLAPTQPRAAGAAAGLLAGGAGAAVYALHCPEVQAPFLAVWYVGGMALPVLAGAALGPRLLRW